MKLRHLKQQFSALLLALLLAGTTTGLAHATTFPPGVPPPDNPQSGSVGLEAEISSPAPTQAANIATPSGGQTFTKVPITVAGLCPKGLLVKIFSNNVFVGSEQCTGGSFSVQADLFSGRNDLVARVYDALGQSGPDSNVVTVTFDDGQFAKFGTRVSLTSAYAKRGADPGQELSWPITLSGGVGPYAISVDWGDGTAPDLISQQVAGDVNLTHTYASAGIYKVVVKATDKNGTAAFLQLVGVGNGQMAASKASTSPGSTTITKTQVMWWPAAVLLPLVGIAFWLGRRHELFSIRKQLEQNRNQYQ